MYTVDISPRNKGSNRVFLSKNVQFSTPWITVIQEGANPSIRWSAYRLTPGDPLEEDLLYSLTSLYRRDCLYRD